MGKRGSILLHVLVTSALVALIAASMMRLSLLRYQVEHRTLNNNQERRYDEAAMGALTSQWNSNNSYCASVAGLYNCSPTSAAPLTSCACTCSPIQANYPTITGSGAPPSCQLSIVSTSLP